MSETADIRDHLARYRAVTLQHFEILSEEELSWRPRPDAFSCGQQLLHIIQSEDFFIRGIFANEWEIERLRFSKPMPNKAALRQQFDDVRRMTLEHLTSMREEMLGEIRRHGFAPVDATVRSWLWFIIEHEVHHKGQLSEYLRALGHVPPYFAIELPLGTRPDLTARAELGGV